MTGIPAHRHGDLRVCGATTVVVQQSFCKVNGRLWALDGDPNSHGDGQLVHSQSFVKVSGIPVIIHLPDTAVPDDLCPILDTNHCQPDTAEGSPNTFVTP